MFPSSPVLKYMTTGLDRLQVTTMIKRKDSEVTRINLHNQIQWMEEEMLCVGGYHRGIIYLEVLKSNESKFTFMQSCSSIGKPHTSSILEEIF